MIKENLKNDEHPQENSNPSLGNCGGHTNKISVFIRFQNETLPVTINRNESINALLEQAIHETKNNSVSKDRFQLKLGGTVLDLTKKVSDYSILEGSTLVLSLTAGGGGNYEKVYHE